MKKILFANMRYPIPFYIGGDSSTIDTILQYMSRLGYRCMSLGAYNPPIDKEFRHLEHTFTGFFRTNPKIFHQCIVHRIEVRTYMKIPFIALRKEYHFQTTYPCVATSRQSFKPMFTSLVKQFKPDIVLTQLEGSVEVMKICEKRQIPCIVFLCDVQSRNNVFIQRANRTNQCKAVIFNSNFTMSAYKKAVKKPMVLYYPPISTGQHVAKHNSKKFITIINPVQPKGGMIFWQIAKRMPDTQFLAVHGWYDPRIDGIKLDNLKNVTIIDFQSDMKTVFAQTKILLVPSIIHEGFGKVVIEAQANGIPVIASNNGGLKEATGQGGVVIEDYKDADEWVRAIHSLSSKHMYTTLSKYAKINANRFDIKRNHRIVSVIDQAIRKHEDRNTFQK
jgi:glycosyltransferase involved in cell wall biosynthesis